MAGDLELDERTQRVIWRGLGNKTVKQIAEETGLEETDVLRIKNEMLTAVDVLTVHQRRQKVLMQLETLANDAAEAAGNAPIEFKAGLMNASIASQKELVRQLGNLQAEANAEVVQLNELRVRELMRLVEEGVMLSVKEWSVRHGLDEDALMAEFRDNLRRAADRRELAQ